MRKTVVLLLLTFAAAAAQAQIKCWTDANGKRTCGDTPPPGAKVSTVRGTYTPSAPPAPASKDAAKKDAKKGGPLTPAEQEQEYRKRKEEEQKSAAKAEQERQGKAAKQQNCEQSKDSLRNLESGQRIARTDSKGELYYLDEAQVAQEVAKARQTVQQACN